ncbi:F-box domain-containing protein [Heracleum sosnowskyi]|uniref:F-box domain-containing protein n=1 Tax=Heracleum sosnowskyi TaxID=360622 RepID=A0AAD8M074_9APIA|nr:F-box domain-containing protein [Heracleum sosnowskyi]
MSRSAATAPGENCTEDLLFQILLRLPVKSLVRFKAVSKTWLSLTTSPDFVKSQLRHALTSNAGDVDNTRLVSLHKSGEEDSIALFRPSSGQLVGELKFSYSQHDNPDNLGSNCFVVGSDIGVVCVGVWNSDHTSSDIYLWNPATNQSKSIPNKDIDEFETPHIASDPTEFFEFAFDPIDSDFKVVKTFTYKNNDEAYYFSAVYSAKKNSWREVKPNPLDIPWGTFDVCIHGYLCGRGNYGMVAFDLNKEVFICNVKLPIPNDASKACLMDFKDSIALVIPQGKGDKINLWTLDDEACLNGSGLEASWTLMASIDHLGSPVQFVKGYLDYGDFQLVSEFENCLSYNEYKNGTGKVQFYYETLKAFKYTETLVSISDFKQVDRQRQKCLPSKL